MHFIGHRIWSGIKLTIRYKTLIIPVPQVATKNIEGVNPYIAETVIPSITDNNNNNNNWFCLV